MTRLFSRFAEGRRKRKGKEIFVFKLQEEQIGLITGPQTEESEGELTVSCSLMCA
jgi:hypothetical protein